MDYKATLPNKSAREEFPSTRLEQDDEEWHPTRLGIDAHPGSAVGRWIPPEQPGAARRHVTVHLTSDKTGLTLRTLTEQTQHFPWHALSWDLPLAGEPAIIHLPGGALVEVLEAKDYKMLLAPGARPNWALRLGIGAGLVGLAVLIWLLLR